MASYRRKCRHCKEYNIAENMVKVPVGHFCTFKCVSDHARAKVLLEREKLKKALFRADKEALKTKSQWVKEAQAAFNAYIRVRDHKYNCVSCYRSKTEVESGSKIGGYWDAGHYRSRGAAKQLRFNLWNVHKQCKKCNGGGKFSHKSKTVHHVYREKLRYRIGAEKVDWLDNNNEIRSFDIEYLKRIKKIFNKKTRMKKKQLGIS